MNNTTRRSFINKLIESKSKVNIYLINGIKLTGTIIGFDEFCLIVLTINGDSEQLINHHAISTIVKT